MFMDFHSVTNVVVESVSLIVMWNIANQLGKHNLSCD